MTNKKGKSNGVRTSEPVASNASEMLRKGSKKEKEVAGSALGNRKKKSK